MSAALTVPHLTTALRGPLMELESHVLDRQDQIEAWFRDQWLRTPAPFYASVDLRNSGYKLAPVDTNLFPAGFNNLNPAFEALCVHALQSAVERICPDARRLLLIPENHTRNTFYQTNVIRLLELMRKAGFEVRVASLDEDAELPATLEPEPGKTLTLERAERVGDHLCIGDFIPCAIVLNNDLSAGRPALLEGLKQEIVPPLALGWRNRKKSGHFSFYSEVAKEFAELVAIDQWLIDPLFRNCGQVDFKRREGETCLVHNVSETLKSIEAKYQEYGITQEPFVVVKSDTGTYGMGILIAKSPDDVQDLNKKQRKKMARTKEGLGVDQVIIQEGVYTFETVGEQNAAAEPVIYMIDHFVVGGFYRVHQGRGDNENLNAPGMHFEPLAFADSCSQPDSDQAPDAQPNRFYTYGVVARLALLAAAREIAGSQ